MSLHDFEVYPSVQSGGQHLSAALEMAMDMHGYTTTLPRCG